MPARTPGSENSTNAGSGINRETSVAVAMFYANITVKTMSRVLLFRRVKSGSAARNASPLERQLTQRFLEPSHRGLEQINYFCKAYSSEADDEVRLKPSAFCASDATKRHGPYFELTYKANGKTVNVKLFTGSGTAVAIRN